MTLSKQTINHDNDVINISTTDTTKQHFKKNVEELIDQQQTLLPPTQLSELERATDKPSGIVVNDTLDDTEVSTIQPPTLEPTMEVATVASIQTNDYRIVQLQPKKRSIQHQKRRRLHRLIKFLSIHPY
jgi:hypothetical protein